jgi:hypothetical protein
VLGLSQSPTRRRRRRARRAFRGKETVISWLPFSRTCPWFVLLVPDRVCAQGLTNLSYYGLLSFLPSDKPFSLQLSTSQSTPTTSPNLFPIFSLPNPFSANSSSSLSTRILSVEEVFSALSSGSSPRTIDKSSRDSSSLTCQLVSLDTSLSPPRPTPSC